MKRIEAEIIGREAAALSIIEIGLGSVLHAFHVPFAGYFLSLNQGFFLSRAVSQSRSQIGARTLPFEISAVAACLKSLSPAGKKLTPMLAISMQGVCFTTGTLLLGSNSAGALLGSVLSALWAFVQPLLLYLLLYGQTLADAATYYLEKFNLWSWLAAIILLKALLAAALALAGFRISEERFQQYRDRLAQAVPTTRSADRRRTGALRGALRDLTRPLFVASLALTATFLAFTESDRSRQLWLLLRPIGLGFLIFLAIRSPWFDEIPALLKRSRFSRLGEALESALRRLE